MAFSVIQTKTFSQNGSAAATLTFSSALTVGNQVVIGLCYDSVSTASLSGGGTWTNIGTQTDAANSQKVDLFYCPNITSSGVTGITCGTLQALTICGAEFNGGKTTAADASDATKAFAANVLTSNAISTSNVGSQTATFTEGITGHNSTVQILAVLPASGTDELIVGHFGDTGGNQTSIGAGAGFTVAVVDLGIAGTGANGLIWKDQAGTTTVPGPNPTVKPKRLFPVKMKQPLAIKAPTILAAPPAPVVTAIAKVTPKRTTAPKTKQPLQIAPAKITAQMAPPTNTIATVKPKPARGPARQVTYIAPMIVQIPGPTNPPAVILVKPKRVAPVKTKQPLRIGTGVAPQLPPPAVTVIAQVKPKVVAPAHKIRLVAIAPPRIQAAASPPVVTTIVLVKPRRTFPGKTKQPLAVSPPAITAAAGGLRQLPVIGVGQ